MTKKTERVLGDGATGDIDDVETTTQAPEVEPTETKVTKKEKK